MKLRLPVPATFAFALAAILAAVPAFAKEAAPAAQEAAAEAGPSMTTLGGLWAVGGICMYPIAGLLVGAIAITIYGFRNTPESKMLTPHLLPGIYSAIDALNLSEVQTICNANPALLTNILSAGIQRVGEDGSIDTAAMEKAMEEASAEEVAAGMKPINYLSIFAQLAPMFGLLGTVTGMIKAFDAIAKGGMGKPDALAGNIGEAMVTTAFGLIVGIPTMFSYFALKSRYSANATRLGRVIGNVLHRLDAAVHRQA